MINELTKTDRAAGPKNADARFPGNGTADQAVDPMYYTTGIMSCQSYCLIETVDLRRLEGYAVSCGPVQQRGRIGKRASWVRPSDERGAQPSSSRTPSRVGNKVSRAAVK